MATVPARKSLVRPAAKPERVGLVAGWGRYPIVVAEALRAAGVQTCCLGVVEHADPALAEICDDFEWIGLAKLGRAIRYFKRHDCRRMTMAGKFHKVVLYRPRFLLQNLPDWRAVKCFYQHFWSGKQDRKDDTLLTALLDAFAMDGIHAFPATDIAPQLLVRAGQLTRRGPSHAERKDIEFGWSIAREMGRLDIGQSVVIKDRTTVAVEAIEGTDECLKRAGQLCPVGGWTLVKVAKPKQDMRFDVPTVGIQTLETMVASGGRVLAIEAGRTILLDEAEFIKFADRNKLTVVALEGDGR